MLALLGAGGRVAAAFPGTILQVLAGILGLIGVRRVIIRIVAARHQCLHLFDDDRRT
ncbi:hypothetical protein [Arthrobacter sp. ATA002]|uniref:hypothetical protein n=1 Tax=Arthrobacter sp. ATA002 TaxID=2991715 RepID=UPI003FA477B7